MDPAETGRVLQSLRQMRKKSRREAAAACGITETALSMYEAGRRLPRDDVRKRIADFYNTDAASIFFDK